MMKISGSAASVFQSTPPCGGDQIRDSFRDYTYDFNPRPLAGATHLADIDQAICRISIHAPLRGRR